MLSGMVKKVTAVIDRSFLEGIGELGEGNLDAWLESDVRDPVSFRLTLAYMDGSQP
ncbi:hypothetical protein PILCRDRAFT_825994 [Piloderma croceum F 1598]|uniref:Uncharacterized protein n=1 Tax=Piloderma croceum (strain F 1598) TaxID=765440 RepID=A0A0C3EW76_PILCF|nr:hypothetical protein PILCRDRAFT_825994 [Piloderma croceum F 1598]